MLLRTDDSRLVAEIAESMPFFDRDGLEFHFRDEGHGLPFVFQHGLGGDLNQPFGLYRPAAGRPADRIRHARPRRDPSAGRCRQADDRALADDLIALLDHLEIDRAIVGGISLGAAVAVNVALRFPDRVLGLVLSRPAWIDRPLPENVDLYATIARLIRELGPRRGSNDFRAIAGISRRWTASRRIVPGRSIGQFEQPRAEECVARLERLAG